MSNLRDRNIDMIDSQKRYINDIETYVKNACPDMQRYIDTFTKRGYLTTDELLELIHAVSEG